MVTVPEGTEARPLPRGPSLRGPNPTVTVPEGPEAWPLPWGPSPRGPNPVVTVPEVPEARPLPWGPSPHPLTGTLRLHPRSPGQAAAPSGALGHPAGRLCRDYAALEAAPPPAPWSFLSAPTQHTSRGSFL